VFAEGGYSAGPRVAFASAGVAAGVIAFAAAPADARRVLREPLALVLLALALLGAISVAWTIGPEARTLRWAAVTLGYAGVLCAAGAAARTERGRIALAAGLGAIALVAGAIGLGAWALHDYPYALKLGGEWRPAGPFEYPPALALLMASAVPAYLAAVRGPRRALAAAGWLGLAASLAVFALASSRIGLALGLSVLAVMLLRGRVALVAAGASVAAAALAFGTGDSFLHGRDATWGAGLEAFLDRPLHGAGADAFLAASARHQDGAAISFAHNLPLELAVELGIAGLLLSLAIYWAIARLALRAPRDWLFLPAGIAFPLANLLDWPWHLAGAGAVWALAAGTLARRSPITQGDK